MLSQYLRNEINQWKRKFKSAIDYYGRRRNIFYLDLGFYTIFFIVIAYGFLVIQNLSRKEVAWLGVILITFIIVASFIYKELYNYIESKAQKKLDEWIKTP